MTHLFCIVDRSGSMNGLEKPTIDGYNEYVGNLRKEKSVKITTVLFDHEFITLIDSKPVKDSPKLDAETYQPRGSTALIDAVCRTINTHKDKVKKTDKALVLIITDGHENASREYTSKDMQKLVHGLEKQGNFSFVYLGANQDAWAIAQDWGFQKGNVSSYHATPTGTTVAFDSMARGTMAYVQSTSMNVTDFYSADKDKLENPHGKIR